MYVYSTLALGIYQKLKHKYLGIFDTKDFKRRLIEIWIGI